MFSKVRAQNTCRWSPWPCTAPSALVSLSTDHFVIAQLLTTKRVVLHQQVHCCAEIHMLQLVELCTRDHGTGKLVIACILWQCHPTRDTHAWYVICNTQHFSVYTIFNILQSISKFVWRLQLESLDVSSTSLSGTLPDAWSNLTQVSLFQEYKPCTHITWLCMQAWSVQAFFESHTCMCLSCCVLKHLSLQPV